MLFILVFSLYFAKNPVLLVPGLGGTQIMYQSTPSTSSKVLWMNVSLAFFNPSSYFVLLKAQYDSNANEFSSISITEPRGWGTVTGLDHLDDDYSSGTYYMHDLIEALKSKGYSDGVNLFGAPYDFRLESYVGTKKTGGLFEKLKTLIESMYTTNNNKPAVIITHSEGSAILRHFFANFVNQDWKDKYIKVWVSAAGAFGGAPSAFHSLTSDRAFEFLGDFASVPMPSMRDTVKYFAGVYWMLPSKHAFSSDFLLANVTSTNTEITVGNIIEGFRLTFEGELVDVATNTLADITAEFTAPNVEMRVYYGTRLDTVGSVTFTSNATNWWEEDNDSPTKEKFVEGDGTVPLQSLTAPEQWKATNTKPIVMVPMDRVEHVSIISNEDFINDVVAIATDDVDNATDDEENAACDVRPASRIIVSSVIVSLMMLINLFN